MCKLPCPCPRGVNRKRPLTTPYVPRVPLQQGEEVEENRQFVQSLSLSHTCILSLPDPLDGLGQTNVVGLKLVPTPTDNEDCEEVEPVSSLANEGDAPRGEVVSNAGSEYMVRRMSMAQFPIGRSYWKPMYVWRMSMEMRPASTRGTAAPAAKGTMVRGTSAMETALLAVSYTILQVFHGLSSHLSKLQW